MLLVRRLRDTNARRWPRRASCRSRAASRTRCSAWRRPSATTSAAAASSCARSDAERSCRHGRDRARERQPRPAGLDAAQSREPARRLLLPEDKRSLPRRRTREPRCEPYAERSPLTDLRRSATKSALRGEVRRQASPIGAPGCGSRKRSSLTRSSRAFDVERDLRHQRDAVAVRHHLHHGREAVAPSPDRRVARAARRTPAPDRAGSGPPPAGSAGRCSMSRADERRACRCAGRRPAPRAGTDRRTAPASRCRPPRPAAPASPRRARRAQARRAALRVWVSRNSSCRSGWTRCNAGSTRGST